MGHPKLAIKKGRLWPPLVKCLGMCVRVSGSGRGEGVFCRRRSDDGGGGPGDDDDDEDSDTVSENRG